jgi:hypothetical protein
MYCTDKLRRNLAQSRNFGGIEIMENQIILLQKMAIKNGDIARECGILQSIPEL